MKKLWIWNEGEEYFDEIPNTLKVIGKREKTQIFFGEYLDLSELGIPAQTIVTEAKTEDFIKDNGDIDKSRVGKALKNLGAVTIEDLRLYQRTLPGTNVYESASNILNAVEG